jgi:hypothetical protein
MLFEKIPSLMLNSEDFNGFVVQGTIPVSCMTLLCTVYVVMLLCFRPANMKNICTEGYKMCKRKQRAHWAPYLGGKP